jgi:hypothetical protein
VNAVALVPLVIIALLIWSRSLKHLTLVSGLAHHSSGPMNINVDMWDGFVQRGHRILKKFVGVITLSEAVQMVPRDYRKLSVLVDSIAMMVSLFLAGKEGMPLLKM